jgi:Ca-activated chloride channel family protein
VRDEAGQTVMTRLESSQLAAIASATGGKHFEGSGGDLGMGQVIAELDRLEKSEFDSRLSVQFATVYEWFAVPALLLLVLGALVAEGGRRKGLAALLLLLLVPGGARAGLLDRPDPDVAAGNEAYGKGDATGALAAYGRAAQAHPGAVVDFDRGAALLAAGRFDEARQALQAALSAPDAGPLAGPAYANLGQALAGMKKNDEAMAAYRRALELDPADEKARHDLAFLLQQKQEQDKQKQQQDQQKKDEEQKKKDQEQQQQDPQQDKDDPKKDGSQKPQDAKNDPQKKDPQQQEQQPEKKDASQGKDGQQQPAQADKPGEKKPEEPAAQAAAGEPKKDGKPDPEARRLLDALREGEKSFQLWRQQKTTRNGDAKQDW